MADITTKVLVLTIRLLNVNLLSEYTEDEKNQMAFSYISITAYSGVI